MEKVKLKHSDKKNRQVIKMDSVGETVSLLADRFIEVAHKHQYLDSIYETTANS